MDRAAASRPGPESVGVVLEEVSMTAAGRSRPVLDQIDLQAGPGERLCLTGPQHPKILAATSAHLIREILAALAKNKT